MTADTTVVVGLLAVLVGLAAVFVVLFFVATARIDRLLDELMDDQDVADQLAPHGNVTLLDDYRERAPL